MTNLSPVTADELTALPGITHAFFTRPGGVSKGIYEGLNAGLGSDDNRDHVVENRNKMAAFLRVKDDRIASPYQVHSAVSITTNRAWSKDRPKADSLVTTTPGLALGIVTADCGPVLFADPAARVIGAAHAGWKGALNGVLEATIEEMEKNGATRSNITAVLGPMISQENYEVGPDFPAAFIEHAATNASFFKPSTNTDHYMFDLVGYIIARLGTAGVKASATRQCTYANENDFFSYRRTTHRKEADYGRQMSSIVLNAE